jgi:cholesterol oxidase
MGANRKTSVPLSGAAGPTAQPLRRDAIKLAFAAALGGTGLASPSEAAGQSPPMHSVAVTQGAARRAASAAIRAQAQSDYSQSLQAFGGRLAQTTGRLLRVSGDACVFDVAVIGSGYGASICAARLAARLRPGGRLCVLERGKEWVPGTFPDRFRECADEARRNLVGFDTRTVHNPTGMINLVQGKDVSVLSASALGGTSLINGNVIMRPDPEVFQFCGWPSLLSDRGFLEPYYDRACWELGVTVEPWDSTSKMKAMRLAAERLADQGAHFEAAQVTVTRGPAPHLPILNRQGMLQRPCTNCGDCTTGCNVGAKNTLVMNYLPIARQHGAQIYTQTEVQQIERHPVGYAIRYRHYLESGRSPTYVDGVLLTRLLVVGAGSLGSTELLLRSRSPQFEFSSRLGHGWSCNGDILGLVRRTDVPTHIAGTGTKEFGQQSTGPVIQSNIRFNSRPRLEDRVTVQDGGVASAYAPIMSLLGRDLGLDHTHMFVVASHDGAQGRIELDSDGAAVVRWPGLYHHPYRRRTEADMQRVAQAIGGVYREMVAFKGRVGTVHPLGGCSMADDPTRGTTNHLGQVFDGRGGGASDPRTGQPSVHPGLYVVDGACIPSSLGVNPMATIAAVAERAAALITANPEHANLFIS